MLETKCFRYLKFGSYFELTNKQSVLLTNKSSYSLMLILIEDTN